MKKIIYIPVGLLMIISLSACESNQSRLAEGAAIGGVTGAVAGGVIGHQMKRNGGEGALIGGALGAASGAAIGSQIERPHKTVSSSTTTTNYAPASASATQLPMSEVVQLSHEGLSSEEIVAKIKSSNSRYTLTSDDIAFLKREGVSQRVIETMQGYY